MRIPFRRAVVSLLGAFAVASCGGSPVTPSTRSSSVVVTLPSGHAASIVPGEKISLVASLTSAEGAYSDCTAAAQWESANPSVAKFTEVPGQLVGVTGGSVSVFATCGGAKSAALALTVSGGVKISGLEAYSFLLPQRPGDRNGRSVHLAARAIDANGALGADCTRSAVWTTSDSTIVTIGDNPYSDWSDPNWLVSHNAGSATVTVNCGGATGQVAVSVQPIRVTGFVRDANGQPVAGANVAVSDSQFVGAFFSAGPMQTTTAGDGSYAVDHFSDTACIRVSRDGATVDQPPCQSSDYRLRVLSIDANLAPLRNVTIEERSVGVCQIGVTDPRCSVRNGATAVVTSFVPIADGKLVIRWTWPRDAALPAVSQQLSIGVSSCNFSGPTTYFDDSIGGAVYQINAARGCTYSLSFRANVPYLPVTYRILQ